MRKLLVIKRRGKLKLKARAVLQLQFKTRTGKTVIREYPLRDLDALLIIGRNISIQSDVLSVLSSMNIPISIIAKDSIGILLNPIIVVNPNYRALQYNLNKVEALSIALEYIKSKINGMVNILKYHRIEIPELPYPPKYRVQNDDVSDYRDFEYQIRLWESQASNILWDYIVELIKQPYLGVLRTKYGFLGRKPRHSDPFNKTLSVMYAVLYSLATKALLAAGLDPTYGFLHRTRYSTPLTFDYTEMFKPIAIGATITLINNYGLPKLDNNGELTREWINKAIKQLYTYLTLRHKDTGRTPYQQIYLKAFCLAKYLEGKCRRDRLTVTWNRAQYRRAQKIHSWK